MQIFIKITDLFKTKQNIPDELMEPEAENYSPTKLKKQIIQAKFDVKEFYTYDYFHRFANCLEFEHKIIAKLFKNLGAAIQCFVIKK